MLFLFNPFIPVITDTVIKITEIAAKNNGDQPRRISGKKIKITKIMPAPMAVSPVSFLIPPTIKTARINKTASIER